MFLPHRVIMTTDLSDLSWKAWDAAASLAQTYGATLTVLHVLEAPDQKHTERLREEARYEIETRLSVRTPTVECKVEIVVADAHVVVTEILEQVEALGADLVVTATHGRTGLAGMVYGSTAEKLVRLSPVPVVSVRVQKLDEEVASIEDERARLMKTLGPLEGR